MEQSMTNRYKKQQVLKASNTFLVVLVIFMVFMVLTNRLYMSKVINTITNYSQGGKIQNNKLSIEEVFDKIKTL
jgi:hypothetical protein